MMKTVGRFDALAMAILKAARTPLPSSGHSKLKALADLAFLTTCDPDSCLALAPHAAGLMVLATDRTLESFALMQVRAACWSRAWLCRGASLGRWLVRCRGACSTGSMPAGGGPASTA
jgi:hypothetical protein